MQINMIRSKISKAIAHEEQTGFLAHVLTKIGMDQGFPYDPNRIAQSVGFIRTTVELVPNMLEEFIKAASEDDALDDINPLMEAAEEFFLSQDGTPDKMGLVGLIDNTYLVYSILISIPGLTENAPAILEFHYTLRQYVGEPLASQLDVIVNSTLNKPDVQRAIQKICSLSGIPPSDEESPNMHSGPAFKNRPVKVRSENAPVAKKEELHAITYTTSVVPVQVKSTKGQKMQEGRAETLSESSVPGYLDPHFGNGGQVITNLLNGMAEALAIQPDGKIIVAGHSKSNKDYSSFTLARYDLDGNLDTTFGRSGCIRIDSDRQSKAHALTLQADGKIIVAGEVARHAESLRWDIKQCSIAIVESRELNITSWRDYNPIDIAISRLNTDGSLDKTFGHGGWLHPTNMISAFSRSFTCPSCTCGTSQACAVAVQEDGKIVVGGYAETDNGCFALARFDPEGNPDSSFGRNGVVIDERGGYGDNVYAVALQADGKILAAGTVGENRKNGKFALTRLNTDGTPDSSFGNEGLVTIELGGENASAKAVTVQEDGKILAAGFLSDPLEKFVLIRCNPDGNLDNTFGNNGVVSPTFDEPKSSASSVALQKDGKILVAGKASVDIPDPSKAGVFGAPPITKSSFALVRYDSNGNPDPSFGNGGIITTDIDSATYGASGLGIQEDGKIIAVGGGKAFAMSRYLNISIPSPSSTGLPDSDLFTSESQVIKVAPESERVNEKPGDLDPSFGKGGSGLIIDLDNADARAIAVQPDGKIVVAGYIDTGQKPSFVDFIVARYNPDGSPDSTFHDTGITSLDFYGDDERAYAIALQEDGKIILAGEAINIDSSSFDFALVRLNPDGIVDRTFGNDGIVLTDFVNASYDSARAIALQADGKIVAAGFMATFKDGEFQTQDFAVGRYNPDGQLDASFGSEGKLTTDFSGGLDRAQAVAIQEDGKIVIAGGTASAGSEITNFGLVRFTSEGILDSTFGDKGKVTTGFGQNENMAFALTIRPDGKILAGGYTASESTKVAVLACYNADGTLDNTFGDNGKLTGLFGGGNDSIYAIAMQADGKILIAGYALAFEGSEAQTQDFAMVRLNSDGSLDASFGSGGVVMTDFWGMNDTAYAVGLQSDGKIVIAGTTDTGSNKSFAIARYLNPVSQSANTLSTVNTKHKCEEKRVDKEVNKKIKKTRVRKE